jgi:hypothetical protein
MRQPRLQSSGWAPRLSTSLGHSQGKGQYMPIVGGCKGVLRRGWLASASAPDVRLGTKASGFLRDCPRRRESYR